MVTKKADLAEQYGDLTIYEIHDYLSLTRSILDGYFNFWYQWDYLLTSFFFLQGI